MCIFVCLSVFRGREMMAGDEERMQDERKSSFRLWLHSKHNNTNAGVLCLPFEQAFESAIKHLPPKQCSPNVN